MIFLLRYWQLILGGIAVVALGTTAFVFHVELVSAQASLAKARAQESVLSSTLVVQNAAIRRLGNDRLALVSQLSRAEKAAASVTTRAARTIIQIKTVPIGPSCVDAMNFLRAEAPKVHP